MFVIVFLFLSLNSVSSMSSAQHGILSVALSCCAQTAAPLSEKTKKLNCRLHTENHKESDTPVAPGALTRTTCYRSIILLDNESKIIVLLAIILLFQNVFEPPKKRRYFAQNGCSC